jgi:hypothetical protein
MGDSRISFWASLVILLGGLCGVIFSGSVIKATHLSWAKVAYSIDHLMVYCEEPNGNEIYVVVNAPAGGSAVYVVPGGCNK